MLRSRQKSSKLGHDNIDGADEHERRLRQTATANKRGFIRTLPLSMLTILWVLTLIFLVTSFIGRPSLVYPSSSTVGSLFSRSRAARTSLQEEEETGGRNLLETVSTGTGSSDGTFNGFPVTYRPGSRTGTQSTNPDSSVHCVGENYGVDAWMYRSCEFRHLCFDLDLQELVLFPSEEEKRLLDLLSQRNNRQEVTIQSIMSPDTKVALGPIQNLSGDADSTSRSINDQRRHLEWFPTAVDDDDPTSLTTNGYYELPENVVLVPFYSTTTTTTTPSEFDSTSTNTQQHWVWQNLLSIFTLLSIFDLQDQQLALIDFNDHPECPPFASPDGSSAEPCHQILSQMLAAMGVRPNQYRSKQSSTVQLRNPQGTVKRQSNFVCARTGAAGLGMIANLAPKPAQVAEEWLWTHTAGRGATLREFRNYMARHLGVSIPSTAAAGSGSSGADAPVKITFFEQGPKEGVLEDGTKQSRELESTNFQESYKQVRAGLSEQEVSVEWFHTSTLDFASQASKAAESAIFITFCGEGTVAATFLPRGASLIVYCDGGDGGENDRNTRWSKRLDWRVLNNAAYFRTHWLPLQSIRTTEGVAALVRLVQSELDLVRQQI
jgi:hypothetical protein